MPRVSTTPSANAARNLAGKREPVLVVDRVLVFAEKHFRGLDAGSTLTHFRPLIPTAQLRANTDSSY